MIRLAVVWTTWWSRQAKRITPGNFIIPLFNAVIDSMSRWSVGSSNMSTLLPMIIMRESSTRTFSPPESTRIFFTPSSPAKSIRPRKPRTYVASLISEYCVSQSTMSSSVSKIAVLSFGKYDWLVVTPHLYEPSSGSSSPARILNIVVFASSFPPTNAILSSWLTVNEILSSTFTPSMVFEMPSTKSTSFPISRSGRKSMYGYLRLDGRISSSWIFSRARFLDVACFDLEAFAEKRWINSCSSLIFSSFFLFASFI